MRPGTIILVFLIAAIFLIWKYPAHAKKVAGGIGGMTDGFKNISGSKGFLWGLLAIVGVVGLWWLYTLHLSLAQVSDWMRENWLLVLVVWLLGALAIGNEKSAKKLGKAVGWGQFILAVAVLGLLVGVRIYTWWSAKEKSFVSPIVIPATKPVTEWPTVTLAPGERSGHIALPNGMHHMRVSGTKYRAYTVYQGGRECSTFGTERCPDGKIEYYYIVNDAPGEDTISYAFVPKK